MSGQPAARVNDPHICPLSDGPKPHGGGTIKSGEPTVRIGGQDAARVLDQATCPGPPNSIAAGSPSVWIGNKPAARMLDATEHGGTILFGFPTVLIGGPASEGWLGGILAFLCPDAQAGFDGLRRDGWKITTYDGGQWEDETFDGTRWVANPMPFGGETNNDRKKMKLMTNQGSMDNAATLYHESVHTQQPSSWSWPQKEYDAYKKTEEWRIAKGLPDGSPPGYNFRTTDAHGNTVVNEAEVRRYVNDKYPYAAPSTPPPSAAMPPAPDQIIGKTAAGNVIVQRSDGTTFERPPQRGDSIPGSLVTIPHNGRQLDLTKLRCP